jgi:hypothetical protein
MYYWEDEKEIRGFKVYNDPSFDEVVASVEKIKKLLKPEEKIGFLYADKNKSLLNKLKEKFGDIFDDKTIDDAQGLEGRYYIIDINQDGIDITDKTEQQLRNEFYTAFTRSEVGGLILSSNRVAQPIKVTNVKMDVSELEKISPESIKATSKKRKEIFDKIFDGVSTEIPPYKPITRTEITSTIETSEETPETEGLLPPPPPPPPAPSSTIPEGMYKTREEAERIDTSAYKPGLELLDKDDNLVGVVEGTSIQEHTDSGGITYYYPAVNIKKRDGSIVAIGLKVLEGHKLKDPTVTALIPKYKVDDVFYDGDAKALRIKTVEVGDSISYILSTEEGSEITVNEADLDRYSTTPPVLDVEEDEKDSLEDLGEHEDPETYERRVRHENASNEKPEVTSDGRISHWLYTFNGYETGVLFDESGRIKPEYFTLKDDVTDDPVAKRSKVRIDNVNGLIKLGAVNTDTKKERCLEILADIHAILMSDTDNASVINRINEYTADNDIVYIEYGIKSSAGISSSDSTKVYGTGDSDEAWHVFDKHVDEKSEYAHKHVVKGDALNRTSVVAVFRNSKGEKVLEITLGSINSPITIGQRLNESGEYIYPEVGQRLEELDKLGRTPTGEEIY